RLAADQGDADAQFNLGVMYARGEGVLQDDSAAYVWFSLGALNGHEDAMKARDIAQQQLSRSELRAAQAKARRRLQAIDSPLTPITPPAQQQTAAQIAFEHGWRSVVVIHTADSQGSGVIIRPNVVATNCHVVDDGSDIVVYKADNRRARTDAPHSASISRADRERDLCLLAVSGL
ncbi:MAG: tetratricopeptide repeat-containing serine protease family protein, partial [Nitrospira sp.]|nr:tetratricopeptide repeat-containing serine protease family protein [Nitrospira sp.]